MDPSVQIREPIFHAEDISLMADANFELDQLQPEFLRLCACLSLFNVRNRQPSERPNPPVI